MAEAQCLCGATTAVLTGEPMVKGTCHCIDCKKISGSMFSTNLFVDKNALNLELGSPKQYSKKADSGNTITSFFCGDCGTTIWRETTAAPNLKILKEGTLGTPSTPKPKQELFSHRRVDWVPQIDGAEQK